MNTDNSVQEEIERTRDLTAELRDKHREAEREAKRAELKSVPLTGNPLTIHPIERAGLGGCRGMLFAVVLTLLVGAVIWVGWVVVR